MNKVGKFVNERDQKTYEYCFRFLKEADIEILERLQNKTYESLQDKTIYLPGDRQTLLRDLRGEGITVGILVQSQLIAFVSIHFMKYDTQINDIIPNVDIPIDNLEQVARYRYTSVDPNFSGNAFGNKMVIWLFNYVRKHFKEIRYYTSMVSPYNYLSLRTQLGIGMYGQTLKRNKQNQLRLVFFKDLEKKVCFDKEKYDIEIDKVELLEQYLKKNYKIIALKKEMDKVYFILGR